MTALIIAKPKQRLGCGISIGVLAMIFGAICYMSMFGPVLASRRPQVPVESLLPSALPLPPEYRAAKEAEAEQVYADMEVTGGTRDEKRSWFSEKRYAWRRWRGGPKNLPNIHILGYAYQNPLVANYWYQQNAPHVYGFAPNFEPGVDASRRYPSDWSLTDTTADEMQVACAFGTPDACVRWFYWGRYGQYLFSIRVDTSEPMHAEELKEIITIIDQNIDQQLEP